jgi:ribose transport system substrate-binding protein
MYARDFQVVNRRGFIVAASLYWPTCAMATRASAAQKTYGVLSPAVNFDYYERIVRGVRNEVKTLGTINLIEMKYKDVSNLITNVQDLISHKVDGLLIVLQSYNSQVGTALEISNSAGIPTVTVDGSLQGASATVVPDFARAAELQAQVAVQVDATGAPYVYVTGPKSEVSSILQRTFDDNVKARVININVDSYSSEEVIDKTSNIISKEPSLNVIAATSDYLAVSAAKAAQMVGKNITVIGLGASPEGIEAINKGLMFATINLKPEEQGAKALELLNGIAQTGVCPNGQKPPCPPKSVTPELLTGKNSKK